MTRGARPDVGSLSPYPPAACVNAAHETDFAAAVSHEGLDEAEPPRPDDPMLAAVRPDVLDDLAANLDALCAIRNQILVQEVSRLILEHAVITARQRGASWREVGAAANCTK